eukprot:TRINITY_DN5100_c0_g1_i1.p1 TRINITY_DN5100_c0_g1~~TRINITY_DN5100_c0_g1_i1.p1  ORF type:complete len:528 (-),score=21.21 TRINITY_DN5100_c0_g1_i1:45-1628(-)
MKKLKQACGLRPYSPELTPRDEASYKFQSSPLELTTLLPASYSTILEDQPHILRDDSVANTPSSKMSRRRRSSNKGMQFRHFATASGIDLAEFEHVASATKPNARPFRNRIAPSPELVNTTSETFHEMSNFLFTKIQATESLPAFWPHVSISNHGGLDRIEELWYPEKYLWFFITVASAALNIGVLVFHNSRLLHSYTSWFHDPSSFEHSNSTHTSESMSTFIRNVPDGGMKTRVLVGAAAVACHELLCVAFFVLYSIWSVVDFASRPFEYDALYNFVYLLQELLPRFGSFSSLTLMAHVHPSILYHDYTETRRLGGYRNSFYFSCWINLKFLSSRLASLAIGLSAFAVKVLALQCKLLDPSEYAIVQIALVFVLMSQCMGSVRFESVLQNRIFLFVFGGREVDYQDKEAALCNVYKCSIAQRMWNMYWKRGERLKAIVMISTLDHFDLQKLILDCDGSEDEDERLSNAGSLGTRDAFHVELSNAGSLGTRDAFHVENEPTSRSIRYEYVREEEPSNRSLDPERISI